MEEAWAPTVEAAAIAAKAAGADSQAAAARRELAAVRGALMVRVSRVLFFSFLFSFSFSSFVPSLTFFYSLSPPLLGPPRRARDGSRDEGASGGGALAGPLVPEALCRRPRRRELLRKNLFRFRFRFRFHVFVFVFVFVSFVALRRGRERPRSDPEGPERRPPVRPERRRGRGRAGRGGGR